jgi:hypothetical protein
MMLNYVPTGYVEDRRSDLVAPRSIDADLKD